MVGFYLEDKGIVWTHFNQESFRISIEFINLWWWLESGPEKGQKTSKNGKEKKRIRRELVERKNERFSTVASPGYDL